MASQVSRVTDAQQRQSSGARFARSSQGVGNAVLGSVVASRRSHSEATASLRPARQAGLQRRDRAVDAPMGGVEPAEHAQVLARGM